MPKSGVPMSAVHTVAAMMWEAGRRWQREHGQTPLRDSAGWYMTAARAAVEYAAAETADGNWYEFIDRGVDMLMGRLESA